MMARISGLGPETLPRRDRISNGLSTAMRDHMAAVNPSRIDMLLGVGSQPQSILHDTNELDEEDVWGTGEGRNLSDEGSPVSEGWKFEIGSGGKDVMDVAGEQPLKFSNGRRWMGQESGLSVAYADSARSPRVLSAPRRQAKAPGTFQINPPATNGNAMFWDASSSVRTPSRLIPNREGKVTSQFSTLSASVENSKAMHQSAPVNVPDWSKIYKIERKPTRDADDDLDSENGDEEERLPPHELVRRELARSQANTFSMCEGIGRTLKGRDLTFVRNAILTQTGFIQ